MALQRCVLSLAGLLLAQTLLADLPSSPDSGGWVQPVSLFGDSKGPDNSWLTSVEAITASPTTRPGEAGPATQPAKGPPLPLHTIEGVGGTLSIPMAYLVNPGPPGTVIGTPAVSYTYLRAVNKDLMVLAISETLYRRIELSYAVDRLDLGSLPHAIDKAGMHIDRHTVYLHHFNARVQVVEETEWLPALTIGAHFKVNDGINTINHELNGALSAIGYHRRNGADFTLTLTKTVIEPCFKRPLILSGGLRNSQASNLGLTGFGDERTTTFEGTVVYLPTNWLGVTYGFRQKNNPYDTVPGLIGNETNWHEICVALILSPNFTIAAGWANLGELGNSDAQGAWGIQLKYEF